MDWEKREESWNPGIQAVTAIVRVTQEEWRRAAGGERWWEHVGGPGVAGGMEGERGERWEEEEVQEWVFTDLGITHVQVHWNFNIEKDCQERKLGKVKGPQENLWV